MATLITVLLAIIAAELGLLLAGAGMFLFVMSRAPLPSPPQEPRLMFIQGDDLGAGPPGPKVPSNGSGAVEV